MAGSQDKLEQIKAQMSDRQRKDMADIISNEIRRREGERKPQPKFAAKSNVKASGLSGSLDGDSVGQMYADTEAELRALRVKKLEEQLSAIRGGKGKKEKSPRKVSGPSFSLPRPSFNFAGFTQRNALMMYALVGIGALKILFSTGVVNAAVPPQALKNQAGTEVQASLQKAAAQPLAPLPSVVAQDKDMLTALDARRAELEERKDNLDRKEKEIAEQAQTLNEKLAELKSLTAKLNSYRTEKDQQHETRLEQLAEVYGSMAPNQAAPLIGKLDDETAISLLQRLTGKRMGQILSSMDSDRAIELTKILSDKKKVN